MILTLSLFLVSSCSSEKSRTIASEYEEDSVLANLKAHIVYRVNNGDSNECYTNLIKGILQDDLFTISNTISFIEKPIFKVTEVDEIGNVKFTIHDKDNHQFWGWMLAYTTPFEKNDRLTGEVGYKGMQCGLQEKFLNDTVIVIRNVKNKIIFEATRYFPSNDNSKTQYFDINMNKK